MQADRSTASRFPHQVWARALLVAADAAAAGGLDIDALCDGLPFDARSMRAMKRVAWDDYVTFVERLEVGAGGPEELRAITRANYYRGIPELQKLLGLVVSPKTLYRFLFEVLDPIVFPMLEWSYVDVGPRDLRITAELRAGLRSCRAVFRSTDGAIEAVPTTLGLPPAVVVGEHTPAIGRWHVTLSSATVKRDARSLSLGALSRTLRSLVIGSEREAGSLDTTILHHGGGHEERIELATQRWKLTRRQAEVLGILADGKSNKEIGAKLDCAEATIEQHVTQLLVRSMTPSRAALIASFWTAF